MRFSSKAGVVVALIILSVFVLVAAGCGSSSDPSAVAEDFVNAVANKDCNTIVDLLAADSQAFFEQGEDDAVAGCEATIGAEFEGQDIVINSFEVTNTTQDGDTAQVDFKMSSTVSGEEQSTEDTVDLVKENGEWKVALIPADHP